MSCWRRERGYLGGVNPLPEKTKTRITKNNHVDEHEQLLKAVEFYEVRYSSIFLNFFRSSIPSFRYSSPYSVIL